MVTESIVPSTETPGVLGETEYVAPFVVAEAWSVSEALLGTEYIPLFVLLPPSRPERRAVPLGTIKPLSDRLI